MILKNAETALIDKILDAVMPLLPEDFGIIVNYHSGNDDIDYPNEFFEIQKAAKNVDSKVNITFGASKFVISTSNLPVVIKIPFSGYYEENDETGELEWTNFFFAPEPMGADYCYAEYKKYLALQVECLEYFVAETAYYKNMCGLRVFLQEKIDCHSDFAPSQVSRATATTLLIEEDNDFLSLDWVAQCIDYYGEELTKKFLSYCNRDFDIIEDAHTGNIGVREDGSPVIFDFSNFLYQCYCLLKRGNSL